MGRLPDPIQIHVLPNQTYIEKDSVGQHLNCDFLLETTATEPLTLIQV